MSRTSWPLRLAFLAVGVVIAVAGQPGSAEAAAIEAEGRGELGSGRATCERQALDDARAKALSQVIARLAGRFDPVRHRALLARARDYVEREKPRGEGQVLADLCVVTARFRFDEHRLRAALQSGSEGGGRVGVVVRYILNGTLAEDAGTNPLAALHALESELQKYNCRLVNMLFEQDEFSRRMQEQMVALRGNDEDFKAVFKTGLSHAQAVRNAITAASEELQSRLRRGEEGFDRIIAAQVTVRDQGRDPDSDNVRAISSVMMAMYSIDGREVLAPTQEVAVPAPAPDTGSARMLAVQASVETAVAAMSGRVSICSGS